MSASALFLTQVLPYPLDSGPKVRAYHVLRWLARRAEVDLVTYVRPDDPPEAVEHLAGLCRTVHTVPVARSRWRDLRDVARALLGGQSALLLRDDQPAMRRAVAELEAARAYDIVHADQLWMAVHASRVEAPLRVLDLHNATWLVFRRLAEHEPRAWRRWLLRREARAVARAEATVADRFDRLLFVSEEDRDAVRSLADGEEESARVDKRSIVVPICVDSGSVVPVDVRTNAHRVTFLGTMYWPPNAEGALWFADHVLPRVFERVPDAVFTVVGKRPPPDVRRLANRFGARVEVLGYVEDLGPLLAETAAFVVPLRSGGGMRVKILDAWAWGLAVVSTTIGAEGIEFRPNVDLELADDPEVMADAVVGLLSNPQRRARLAAAGRAAVEERYDAVRVYEALSDIFATEVAIDAG